ncbi:hypothetical protein ABIC86_003768 [Paenibacillus sp. DS2363]|uniref:hypothetical protein n=1 Tax=unclassified Paenibacillus TaxID=185978 RepID=UPI0030FBBAA0
MSGAEKAAVIAQLDQLPNAILPPHLPHEATVVLDVTRASSIRIFMKEYEKLSGIGFADIEPWIKLVAVAN